MTTEIVVFAVVVLAAALCVLLLAAWAFYRIGRELDDMEWEDD